MTHTYLFVCRYNKMRSPYAATWFAEYCKEHNIDAVVKSAGIHVENPTRTQLTKPLVDWADTIIVMEDYMAEEIINNYQQSSKNIVNLNVADIFDDHTEESPMPYDDNTTPAEAIKLLEAGFIRYSFRKHFGKRFFNKILQAKLEDIVKEV